jgi:hypothetical protein
MAPTAEHQHLVRPADEQEALEDDQHDDERDHDGAAKDEPCDDFVRVARRRSAPARCGGKK